MVKGIGRVDDARRAVDAGVTAISVSNHGGNNLDGTPATIRVLPAMVEAVGDEVEVLLDGGIRRGSDVVKALALGARAVMIGRAYLWGLAANGQAGVENVLDILRGRHRLGAARARPRLDPRPRPDDVVVPDGFSRRSGSRSGSEPMTAPGSRPARRRRRRYGSEAPVALVTGAARGIGAATVRTLVQWGYGVIALDLATVERAQPHDRVVVVRGDVRDPGDVAAAVDLAQQRWGRLDVAVAAAAFLGGRPLGTPVADLEQLWRTDLVGSGTSRRGGAGDAGRAGPFRGRMVAIASAAGTRGLYGLSAYTVVKHAVVGLVRGLAADLVGTG